MRIIFRTMKKIASTVWVVFFLSILYDLLTMSSFTHNLHAAVKFIVLLPCTRVYCERRFPKLKLLEILHSKLSWTVIVDSIIHYVR